jgi:hypothetical protein
MGARRGTATVFLVVAGLCGLGSLAALAGAVYWFGQTLEPNARLAKMERDQQASQRAGNTDTQGAEAAVNMLLGGLGGFGTRGLEATMMLSLKVTALEAEKRAYQYLCLALPLGVTALWLAVAGLRRLLARSPSEAVPTALVVGGADR